MNLFYTPDITGDDYALNEEESRHCLKVLRLTRGGIIHVTDGKGNLFEAVITDATVKHCHVRISGSLISAGNRPSTVDNRQLAFGFRPYRLHIAIAPTKNIDRFEWFLEKATEIGIDEITPLICEHSERRQIRSDRLEKVITSAMKQSLKAWHPKLNEALGFSGFLENNPAGEKYIACITEGAPLLKQIYPKAGNAIVLIGPEGDFSPAELEKALKNGYKVVSLGNSRLRTETAGVVACHTIYLMNMV